MIPLVRAGLCGLAILSLAGGAAALIAWSSPLPVGADAPIAGPGGGYMFTKSTGGIVMNECLVNNPDVVDMNGNLPEFLQHDICEPYGFIGLPGISVAGLSDALYHTPQIRQGLPNICTDFTDPYGDPINLGDALIMTPYIKAGTGCDCIITF